MSSIRLSVLDLTPVVAGESASQALANTLDLARHAERIGLHRYWLAEHHNAAGIASSAPEIMIAAVAAATRSIRVGSGGVMLPNHSALKVAETFRVLQALHPGRIDLGVGRAAGTDPRTALALRESPELAGDDRFGRQLDDLLAFLTHDPDPTVPFGPIKAVPTGVAPPDVFVLGSSANGGTVAARLGLGFAYAHHINPSGVFEALEVYRNAFSPSPWRREPYAILAMSAVCAEDAESAEVLASSQDLAWIRFGQGLRDLPLPSVEEARAYRYDADEEVFRRGGRARTLVGSAKKVADAIRACAALATADEVMIMTHVHDHAARRRSYELLRDELSRPRR